MSEGVTLFFPRPASSFGGLGGKESLGEVTGYRTDFALIGTSILYIYRAWDTTALAPILKNFPPEKNHLQIRDSLESHSSLDSLILLKKNKVWKKPSDSCLGTAPMRGPANQSFSPVPWSMTGFSLVRMAYGSEQFIPVKWAVSQCLLPYKQEPADLWNGCLTRGTREQVNHRISPRS